MNVRMHPQEFISGPDVARLAGVNQSTVSRWVKKGLLKPDHRGTGRRSHMWFRADDVLRLIDDRGTGTAA
jgi:DNA-binding transcriptional MerR regulator